MRGDLIPLRQAADELALSTTMLRRAWRDEVLTLVRVERSLFIERAELERVKRECRCSTCGALTLGKVHPSGDRYCEAHRGKANAGKSIAAGTRAPTGEIRLSDAERERRRKARREASVAMWANPAMAASLREHRREQHAERRRLLDRAKVGEVKLWEISEVAARVGRSRATVTQHVLEGLIQPDVVVLGLAGRPAYLFTEKAITDYEHKLAEYPDGRMQRFAGGAPSRDARQRPRLVVGRDEAARFNAAWCQATGLIDPELSFEAAMAEVRPTVKARRTVFRFRAGAPKKDRLREDLLDAAASVLDDEREGRGQRLAPWELLDAVAQCHRDGHPEDWPEDRYPSLDDPAHPDHRRSWKRARQRVRDLVGDECERLLAYYHGLIEAGRKIPAA